MTDRHMHLNFSHNHPAVPCSGMALILGVSRDLAGALDLTRRLPLARLEATWSLPESQLDAQLTAEVSAISCHGMRYCWTFS